MGKGRKEEKGRRAREEGREWEGSRERV